MLQSLCQQALELYLYEKDSFCTERFHFKCLLNGLLPVTGRATRQDTETGRATRQDTETGCATRQDTE